jgi:hypothetical protein
MTDLDAARRNARAELAKLPGFKQRELRPCAACGKGLAHDGNFLFWRIKFDRLGFDAVAIEQQHGLELMLRSPGLAFLMGPDRDIAKVIDGGHEALVCEPCVMERLPGLFLIADNLEATPAVVKS